MAEELEVGIIGLGGFAGVILQSLAGVPGIKLAAGADVNAERREKVQAAVPALRLYASADELLAAPGVDIVVVATPPYLHAELGEKVLRTGRHLFAEKPGALRPEELARLRLLAEERGLQASIDFVMRRNPLYFLLKDLTNQGFFGLVERAYLENYAHDDQLDPTHWFWDPTKSGGIWVEHGVHFLDAVHWLLGPADWVWAAGFARPKEHLVERVAGTVGLKSGCVVSYYHGFTKPEAFEDTVFALVWERAYGALHGWIPVRLTLDALVTPEVEAYLTYKALERARAYLPGVDVKLTAVQAEPLGEAATFRGRGRNYRATARLRLTYELSHDRWTVYRACVRQGLLDLAVAVRDPARSPAVTLADAEAALRVAAALTASAAGGQRVFL